MVLDLIRNYTHLVDKGPYGKKIMLTEFRDIHYNQYLWFHEENCKTFLKIVEHEKKSKIRHIRLDFNIRNIIKEDKTEPFIYRIERPRIKEEK